MYAIENERIASSEKQCYTLLTLISRLSVYRFSHLWMKEPATRGGGLSLGLILTVVPVQVLLVLITGVAREPYTTRTALLPNMKQVNKSTIFPTQPGGKMVLSLCIIIHVRLMDIRLSHPFALP